MASEAALSVHRGHGGPGLSAARGRRDRAALARGHPLGLDHGSRAAPGATEHRGRPTPLNSASLLRARKGMTPQALRRLV